MKFLKVIGWIFAPYIMIFILWKSINDKLKIVSILWAVIAFFIVISNIMSGNHDPQTQSANATKAITVTPTETIRPQPTIDAVAQKAYDDKVKADAAAKVITDKATKEKADADAKAAAAEKQKKLDAAAANLRTKTDEVQDITWYFDNTSPKYSNYNAFYLYFAKDKDKSVHNLRLMIQYAGDDWVFVNKYIIKVDDQTFEITPEYGEVKTDNNGNGVWEYYDTPVVKKTLDIAKAIAASKKTIIRYQGDQHQFDRVVTDTEKQAITNVLDAYEAMGGSDLLLKYDG